MKFSVMDQRQADERGHERVLEPLKVERSVCACCGRAAVVLRSCCGRAVVGAGICVRCERSVLERIVASC